uniref:RNASEK-C17orf49 readthrough (Non-protein coding) n=1 Tax=Steinernema glaseri TaxID=37863 RepID=A0A1I8A2S3_9BILA
MSSEDNERHSNGADPVQHGWFSRVINAAALWMGYSNSQHPEDLPATENEEITPHLSELAVIFSLSKNEEKSNLYVEELPAEFLKHTKELVRVVSGNVTAPISTADQLLEKERFSHMESSPLNTQEPEQSESTQDNSVSPHIELPSDEEKSEEITVTEATINELFDNKFEYNDTQSVSICTNAEFIKTEEGNLSGMTSLLEVSTLVSDLLDAVEGRSGEDDVCKGTMSESENFLHLQST